jgi:hypothetical protein
MIKERIDYEIKDGTRTNEAIFCPKACVFLPNPIADWAGVVI